MPDEHSGGAPSMGHKRHGKTVLHVEYHDGDEVPVPVHYFDFDELDSLDDLAKECLKQHGSLKPIISQMRQAVRMDAGSEAVQQMLYHLRKAKNFRLEAWVWSAAYDLICEEELTNTKIAELFGISKQDFQQLVKRCRNKMRGRKTRTMRDEEARENMRLANIRHTKAT